MKISLLVLAPLCLARIHASAAGIEGSLVYQTARPGHGLVPIYDIDPDHPTLSVSGDDLALYANRRPVLGDQYVAELWIGPSWATEFDLVPVLNGKSVFRDTVNAIIGNNNLHIPGSLGGDMIAVQLRVWASHDGNLLLNTWDDVLNDPKARRGTSDLGHVYLGNISANGYPYIPQYLGTAIHGFGLFVIPEPNMMLTGLGSLGGLLFLRRRSP